jgi:hypothetical protein
MPEQQITNLLLQVIRRVRQLGRLSTGEPQDR